MSSFFLEAMQGLARYPISRQARLDLSYVVVPQEPALSGVPHACHDLTVIRIPAYHHQTGFIVDRHALVFLLILLILLKFLILLIVLILLILLILVILLVSNKI